jgi:hypothetical protein
MGNIGTLAVGRRRARPWAVGLAVLAIFLQGMAPSGFMVSRRAGGVAIVLCTCHGPAAAQFDLTGHPAKAPKTKPDPTCAFAGHATSAGPPVVATIATPYARTRLSTLLAWLKLAPGPGLAAPLPPSQAPPNRIA